jgi:hypothetical protein
LNHHHQVVIVGKVLEDNSLLIGFAAVARDPFNPDARDLLSFQSIGAMGQPSGRQALVAALPRISSSSDSGFPVCEELLYEGAKLLTGSRSAEDLESWPRLTSAYALLMST